MIHVHYMKGKVSVKMVLEEGWTFTGVFVVVFFSGDLLL